MQARLVSSRRRALPIRVPARPRSEGRVAYPDIGGVRCDGMTRGVEEVQITVGDVQLFDGVGGETGSLFGFEIVRGSLERRRGRVQRLVDPSRHLTADREKQPGTEEQQNERERSGVPQRQLDAQPAERHAGSPKRYPAPRTVVMSLGS